MVYNLVYFYSSYIHIFRYATNEYDINATIRFNEYLADDYVMQGYGYGYGSETEKNKWKWKIA